MSEPIKVPSNVSTGVVSQKGPPIRPKKTVLVTMNPNRVVEVVFSTTNPAEPVTVEEVNRIVTGIRSQHQKYLRTFRSNQRLDQIKSGEQEMIKSATVGRATAPVAREVLSQVK